MNWNDKGEFRLFSEIAKLNPLNFFTVYNASELDKLYMSLHGKRTLSEFAENTDFTTLAQHINILYAKEWDKINDNFNSLIANLGVGESVKTVLTKTGTITTEGENTNNISGYNSDDFIPADETKDKNTQTNNTTDTTETTSIKVNGDNLENLKNYFTTNIICGIVFVEVNSLFTLNIFESEV